MFIIIELFDPYWPVIVSNEEGKPLLFNSREEAEGERINCQKGIIVEI